jgi:hypothetical protein
MKQEMHSLSRGQEKAIMHVKDYNTSLMKQNYTHEIKKYFLSTDQEVLQAVTGVECSSNN